MEPTSTWMTEPSNVQGIVYLKAPAAAWPAAATLEQRHAGGHVLKPGDVLVGNFNNSADLQGTGTTIVEIAPDGHTQLFAQIHSNDLPDSCPGGVGLTTALIVLQKDRVIVGSLSTVDGMSATAKAGCLIVLNSQGHVVETIAGAMISGPWDMTVFDAGEWAALFVTNVLNGTVATLLTSGSLIYFLERHRRELIASPALLGKIRDSVDAAVQTFA